MPTASAPKTRKQRPPKAPKKAKSFVQFVKDHHAMSNSKKLAVLRQLAALWPREKVKRMKGHLQHLQEKPWKYWEPKFRHWNRALKGAKKT